MVSAVGTFFIVLAVLIILAAVGWVVFTQLRARRLGLPPPPILPFSTSRSAYSAPQSRQGGFRGWISSFGGSSKPQRSAAGAYESSTAARHGFGPLDSDDAAWDSSHVGYEAELDDQHHRGPYGLHSSGAGGESAYTGSGYHMNLAGDGAGDDSSRGRSPMPRGGAGGLDVGNGGARNPFDDDAADPSDISLRGVSPRPIDTRGAAAAPTGHPPHDSPTSHSERRSVFTENV
ncbi:hypothetical protein F5Y16DRAFT_360019 [Xylariaceae sp. FL0255]|nr:hypothetical protein F5Y16DRAFT_360019 [Xylariaceae sp. FL0255]